MATAPASTGARTEARTGARIGRPRAYGLDAICVAALELSGGEDAAQFARRLYERVADKDLAAASPEQRGAAAISLLAFARLTTKHGLFPSPLSAQDAMTQIQDWCAAPSASWL